MGNPFMYNEAFYIGNSAGGVKVRDIELESAYWADRVIKGNMFKVRDVVKLSDSHFASFVSIDHGEAITMNYEFDHYGELSS